MNNALRNKVQLIGNIGKAPEFKTFESGKKMVKFSLATNESYRNVAGERVTETQWHNIIAWGKVAELAMDILDKGKEVSIEGKLMNNTYTDKSGVKRYFTQIQAHQLMLVENPAKEEEVAQA